MHGEILTPLGGGRFERLCLALFALGTVYLFVFTGVKDNIACNRHNDSWSHIALADEYLRTGVFAADAYMRNAPRAAQFGLSDCVAAWLAVLFRAPAETTWSWAMAVNLLAASWACFVCGYWVSGRCSGGVFAFVCWVAFTGDLGFHGLAFPFRASVPILLFLLLWILRAPAGHRWRLPGAILQGAALGILFDLHAFTGLWGGAGVALIVLGDTVPWFRSGRRPGSERAARYARGLVVFGAAAFAAALPWVRLHLSLRPMLAAHNAHQTEGYSIGGIYVAGLVGATAALLAVYAALRDDGRARTILRAGLTWCAVLLVGTIPFINHALARVTSTEMAVRVVSFTPIPVLAGAAWRLFERLARRHRWKACVLAGVCMLGAAAPFAKRAAVHLYLLRTSDLDVHWCAHLRRLDALDLNGKTVLSDPFTSYYCRGMLGCYCVTVPKLNTSPVFEYDALDERAKTALRSGPEALKGLVVDAVVVEKKHGLTKWLMGAGPKRIKARWLEQGWRVAHEDEDVLAITPP